jgi:hypothetical protein
VTIWHFQQQHPRKICCHLFVAAVLPALVTIFADSKQMQEKTQDGEYYWQAMT